MKNHDIVIFGDICPNNNYRSLFDRSEYGPFSKEIAVHLASAALTIGNLECPATDNKQPIVKCGPNLRAEPKDIVLLKRLGFDVLSLANNHILDYGLYGVEQTLQLCEEARIATVGTGKNAKAAATPVITTVAEKRVGIISFAEAEFNLATQSSAGANHFDPYDSVEAVQHLKAAADYVIVLYHGGIEHYRYPSPQLQKKCRKLAEAGADLVLCQHSHCIGTMEKYAGSTILYGQGNSVFGYRKGNDAWNEGLAVAISLEDCSIDFLLLKATQDGVSLSDKGTTAARLNRLYSESKELSEPEIMAAKWSEYCRTQAAMDLPMLFGKGRVWNKLNRLSRNRLMSLAVSRKKKRITMNLLRCEAHHEVIQTILSDELL